MQFWFLMVQYKLSLRLINNKKKNESLHKKHYISWKLDRHHNILFMTKNDNFVLWQTSHPNTPTALYFEGNPMIRLQLMSFLGSMH